MHLSRHQQREIRALKAVGFQNDRNLSGYPTDCWGRWAETGQLAFAELNAATGTTEAGLFTFFHT